MELQNLDKLGMGIITRAVEDYKDSYKVLMRKFGSCPKPGEFTNYGDAERLCDKLYGPSRTKKQRDSTPHRTLWWCVDPHKWYYKGYVTSHYYVEKAIMFDSCETFFRGDWFQYLALVLWDGINEVDGMDPERLMEQIRATADEEMKNNKKYKTITLSAKVD